MPRDFKVFLTDILQAIERIEEYAGDLSYEDFCEKHLVQDGSGHIIPEKKYRHHIVGAILIFISLK